MFDVKQTLKFKSIISSFFGTNNVYIYYIVFFLKLKSHIHIYRNIAVNQTTAKYQRRFSKPLKRVIYITLVTNNYHFKTNHRGPAKESLSLS